MISDVSVVPDYRFGDKVGFLSFWWPGAAHVFGHLYEDQKKSVMVLSHILFSKPKQRGKG